MNIGNISESQKTYDILKRGLDASATREKVIVNNIANVNTKGYKKNYVTFEDTLKESKNELELKKTNRKHISNNDSDYGEINIKRDESTSMKKDGNNVDIDNEMVNLAANNLKYNALVTELNSRMSMTKYVITGGR
ncbi:flagellar basal body rod protein FlgB [Clostridium aestuarii]|uniref:Flagellar basal body rod protein FlgB n=1 Tax=Clostridium aestuarii TaxID=338193 RepID=A0ABT4CXF2_9CLOT|nr:flagellar basal body rod protein FlgB [Clostridium aestuarii]MCY6483677.1 flagellar basal body rod protein FlgB [Clostridium aestuarii]